MYDTTNENDAATKILIKQNSADDTPIWSSMPLYAATYVAVY